MRTSVITALVALAAELSVAGTPPKVRVVREGVAVPATRPQRIMTLLVDLVQRCSVNSTASVDVGSAWVDGLTAPSFIHLRLPDAREMRILGPDNQERRPIVVREILLVVQPDAWPSHALLQTSTGAAAVTKYPPCPLVELLSESRLAQLDREKTRFADERLLAACKRDSER